MVERKTYNIRLTAAIVRDGHVVKAGTIIGCGAQQAKNLMDRGKGRLADEQPGDEDDLSNYKVPELKEMAAEAGIQGCEQMKKADLIKALESDPE